MTEKSVDLVCEFVIDALLVPLGVPEDEGVAVGEGVAV